MDPMMRSMVTAMDAVLGTSKLPPAPRIDGSTIREDEPCQLWLEYRVNADDYCELVRVFVNFGGTDAEIPIRCFSRERLAEMEATCAEDWDADNPHPYARFRK